MADTAVAPAGEGAAGDAGAAPAEGGVWGAVKGMAFRMLIIYFASSFLKGFGGGGSGGSQPAPAGAKGAVANAKGYAPARNMFPPGQLFDMYMYLLPHGDRFEQFEGVEPFWTEYGLKYGDWEAGPNKDGSLTFARTIDTPAELQRNQSIWLHVFITKAGHSPNPNERSHLKRETIYDSKQLNKFRKKYYKKTANLLTGESEQSDEDLAKAEVMKYEVLNYWHPNMTISLVDDHTAWTKDALPSPLDQAVKFDPTGMQYKPIFMFNDYWNLVRDMQPVNETVKQLNVSITYAPLSLFKFQLYASQQMQNKWSSMLSGDMFEEPDDDKDSIKEALLETNPVLLGVTAAVSLLHTVFEFLAFKNDIQFWRTKKDLVGLSVRSVLFNLFQSAVVFLYICDNDTNFVVKMSVFVGLLIEGWKIPKVLDVKVDYENKWLGVIPRVSFSDKGSYIESATKEYDQMAFRYLSWALYPLIVGYAIYSLIYHEQRGWYSWVLSMMYGFLLTFGFIVMTPQLFINYKLKSVAHLPWRMLTYKFINTFIDDLFAFVIKMPTMYRLGCFRDDIIFLVYLYQRWAYRVDPTRMNEYGTSMDDPSGAEAIEAEKAKEQQEKGGAGEEKTHHKEESKKDK